MKSKFDTLIALNNSTILYFCAFFFNIFRLNSILKRVNSYYRY